MFGIASAMLVGSAVDYEFGNRVISPIALSVGSVVCFSLAAREREPVRAVFGLFVLFSAITSLVRGPFDSPVWMYIGVVGGLVLFFVGNVAASLRAHDKRKELERVILSEAAAVGFYVVVLAAIVGGFAETFLELGHPSPWWFAGAGVAAYAVARFFQRRKYL